VTAIIRASAALWGLGLAVAVMPRLQRPAAPDALPGAMRALGLSSSGPMLQFALLILLPVVCALLAARIELRGWAVWAFAAALATTPLTGGVALHALAAAIVFFARRIDPRFTRADIVLLPVTLALYFAFLDLGFGATPSASLLRAAVAALALRLVIGILAKGARPGLAFIAAPVAFVAQMQWLETRPAAILALAWVIGTALLLARVSDRITARLAAYVTYPIALAAYPLALLGAGSAPHLDFFEDGHSLLPASEMARGEKPYREIVPMHAFVSDGLLDLAVMKTIGDDLGTILTARRCVATLSVVAIYFVALAGTTSAHLALLATFLSLSLFPAASLWMRASAPLAALACAIAATRLRSRRWFAVSGALLPIAALVSLDLAMYSAVVAGLAALRTRAVRPLAAGIAIVAVPMLLAFAIAGFAPAFVNVTLFEIIAGGSVYVVDRLALPALRIDDPKTIALAGWLVALIASSAALARSPLRMRRRDAVWMIGAWIVVAGASWVVRRHLYFAFALAPFAIAALVAIPRRARATAAALAILIVFLARPAAHVFDVATPLRKAGGVPGQPDTIPGLNRARGAVIDPATKAALPRFRDYVAASLRPDETFYDFANAATLYYLLERDCPVRHVTVPLYERAAHQREVIAALERNARVRAALVAFPGAPAAIDGVPNRERAPLVWQYLQQHFEPALNENGLEVWKRRQPAP
jgi:hypothetical protein